MANQQTPLGPIPDTFRLPHIYGVAEVLDDIIDAYRVLTSYHPAEEQQLFLALLHTWSSRTMMGRDDYPLRPEVDPALTDIHRILDQLLGPFGLISISESNMEKFELIVQDWINRKIAARRGQEDKDGIIFTERAETPPHDEV